MFPTTRWTLVLASQKGGEEGRAALEALLSIYWKPLYFYTRRKGLSVESAEDAVQGLFLQLVERDFPARLDAARGRFRSYLLTAMDHYLINQHERESAQKRGGGVPLLPLDAVPAECELATVPEDPVLAFEREWALGLMERALGRLHQEYEQGGRKGRAEAVLRFFRLDGAPTYAEAAAECGMTVSQWKAALHRARGRFRAILREEVMQTVAEDREAEEEMGDLLRLLSK
jgi:RNA polymerase sigma-70 factor (ECF subfamily)